MVTVAEILDRLVDQLIQGNTSASTILVILKLIVTGYTRMRSFLTRISSNKVHSTLTTLFIGNGMDSSVLALLWPFSELVLYCRHSLAYTYENLLEGSLQEFKERWNQHRIRPNRTAGCPPGSPDDLYFLPHVTG